MKKKKIFYAILFGLAVFAVYYISIRPSNGRDWSADQAVLAFAEFKDDNTIE